MLSKNLIDIVISSLGNCYDNRQRLSKYLETMVVLDWLVELVPSLLG